MAGDEFMNSDFKGLVHRSSSVKSSCLLLRCTENYTKLNEIGRNSLEWKCLNLRDGCDGWAVGTPVPELPFTMRLRTELK